MYNSRQGVNSQKMVKEVRYFLTRGKLKAKEKVSEVPSTTCVSKKQEFPSAEPSYAEGWTRERQVLGNDKRKQIIDRNRIA